MSIQRLLPSRVDPTPPDDPDVFALNEDDASDALDALAAETARQILTELYERPRSPTELQGEVGTSLQNVHYHLDNLESTDLIRQVGTRYSEKGNEMAVYGPASEAVVFVAGESESRIKRAFSRILGAVALLAGGSLVFGAAVERWLAPEPEPPDPSGPGIMSESLRTTTEVINAIDPALAFFIGGLFALVLVVGWWTLRLR